MSDPTDADDRDLFASSPHRWIFAALLVFLAVAAVLTFLGVI